MMELHHVSNYNIFLSKMQLKVFKEVREISKEGSQEKVLLNEMVQFCYKIASK